MGVLKLYNRDANGFTSDLPLGGLPVYSDDLKQLENNSMLFGLYSMLKGWSCILSGCLVDTLNTSTNKLNMTAGLILINDIIYSVPALTNQSYPFSFIKGAETIDTRDFQNGNINDVATSYDYAIKTSFTFVSGKTYPSNLTTQEIYFDPFSAQRAEYILSNINKSQHELLISEAPIYTIIKTETGKNIVGGSLSANANSQWRWKYYGYAMNNEQRYLRSAGNAGTLTNGGADTITILRGNVPKHSHGVGSLANSIILSDTLTITPASLVNNTASGGILAATATAGDGGGGSITSYFYSHPQTITVTHPQPTISGFSEDGTAAGLGATPISILPIYRTSYHFHWVGYTDTVLFSAGYTFYNMQIKYTNM